MISTKNALFTEKAASESQTHFLCRLECDLLLLQATLAFGFSHNIVWHGEIELAKVDCITNYL